ncbi:hypothetical protein [Parafilimonas sp.]|uniref:hypothetical protein n=1 Tax=Parafilimonas sp. TaxID=1969739 RepID=UPI0039E70C44
MTIQSHKIRVKQLCTGFFKNTEEQLKTGKGNAGKFAFINYVQQLAGESIVVIDCQVYTKHLESLGAEMIGRNEFLALLQHIA